MPQNSETRILKTNTLEQLRQKSNDVSLDLGDNKLIDSRILDKTISFTAAASQVLFESGTMRYELKSGETLDDITHSISNPVGRVRVYSGSTELTQALSGSNTFKTPLYVANIALTGSPTLTEFVENTVVYQAASAQTDLSASAVTFQGKILSASVADGIRLKTDSGTYNTNAALRVHPGTSGRSVSTNTITSSQHTSKTTIDGTYGRIIQLNNAASSGDVIKVVSHSLVDAINEVQDDVGDITSLNTNTSADIVSSINELEVGVRGTSNNLVAAGLTTTANDLLAGINELDAEIGNVSTIDDESGYSATTVVGGITELQDHLGTKASLTTTAKGDLVLAINEVDANADASMKLVSSSAQTLNTNLTFGTSGKTLTFGTGTTLDIRSGTLLTGGGAGSSLGFDTAFLDLTPNTSIRGLSFERSNHISGAPDVEFRFNETQVSGNKEARAFQVKGLNDSGGSEVADLVTFYNAKELFANNTETGISVDWDSTNQNFDIVLSADPVITLGGDLTGNATLTNLGSATLTATIAAGSVENSMLAGSIANDKLAGSIANNKLANSSITVSDGSNSTPRALGSTITFQGTSGEVEVVESSGTVTVGLPNNVTVGGNLTITGNLDVNGTQTTINTSTLEVDDTLILTGTSSTEPTTGGFGFETRSFTGIGTHSNNASNVTGSHSIVYNFATDRWEADGSLILSEATLGNATVEGTAFGSGKNLVFSAGSGLSEAVTGLSGNTYTVTYTNTDKGSDQFIFRNVAVSGQSTIIADSNDGVLNIVGGNAIDALTNAGTDTLTIQHSDTSSVSNVNNTGNTFVQDITFDTHGHVQSVNSVAVGNLDNYQHWLIDADSGSSEQITSTETVQFIGGTGLTTSRSGNNITTTLDNTSVSAGSYGGSLQLNSFTVDAQGRLTAAANGSTISGTGLISVAANGTISTTADNFGSWSFDTSSNGTNETVTSGDVVRFSAGTGMQVNHSGDTITFTNTSTNTDTNTRLQIDGDSGTATNFSGNTNNEVTIAGGQGINTAISGNTLTVATALTELSTTTTQGDADFFVVVNSAGSEFKMAPGSIPISYFSNNSGFTSNTGTVTSVSGSNGISGTVTGSGSLSMSGNYSGNFSVSGEISATGDVVAFASDDRLKDKKDNIENALDKVKSLNGFHFNWNDEASHLGDEFDMNKDMVGVSAQEVEQVLPEAVRPAPVNDKYKTVQYEKLVPLLIEAIKDLNAEIEELKSINKKV
ncbi:MAG: hypothetical protein CBC25_03330 [Pelagibacteraceae bacterium TMED65]|nr:MAG: hypothetical protein CBC25_03330 [Pelagibacteraceae bacterium TMED65]